MSEIRFILCQDDLGNYEIRDDDKVFHFLWEVAPILNEQQAIIIKQDEEIKKLKRTERSWRKIHCCNKESDNCGIVIEQQYTIKQLQTEKQNNSEENKRLRKENERQNNEIKLLRKAYSKIPKGIREVWKE